jgi:hypothetical protein
VIFGPIMIFSPMRRVMTNIVCLLASMPFGGYTGREGTEFEVWWDPT